MNRNLAEKLHEHGSTLTILGLDSHFRWAKFMFREAASETAYGAQWLPKVWGKFIILIDIRQIFHSSQKQNHRINGGAERRDYLLLLLLLHAFWRCALVPRGERTLHGHLATLTHIRSLGNTHGQHLVYLQSHQMQWLCTKLRTVNKIKYEKVYKH